MTHYRTRNILIALGLAVLAVVFMMAYVSQVRSDENLGKELVNVFVANHDITEGTAGATLGGGALAKKQVPRRAVVPGAISEPDQIAGLIATQETLTGEQVTARRFGPLAAAGVRSQISKKERAYQVAGDPNQVLDGTLKPGDHVDIIATWNKPESCTNCHVSRVIVRDALVLKTSDEINTDVSVQSSDGSAVQLRLTDAESERFFWVAKNGEWTLVLRPVLKPRNSVQGYDSSGSILNGSLKRKKPSA
jgi:pilus assembly protein CpaB